LRSPARPRRSEEVQETGTDAVVASFLIAVCDGLVLQWLLDPHETPSGEQLVSSLNAALARALQKTPIQSDPAR
jgi:hypothetical protein